MPPFFATTAGGTAKFAVSECVGTSRYITREIRLGVKTGATPEESGLS